ncbi:MAG: 5,10-methylenetetrahydrofolate reductase [Candidatus Methanomethylicota archaeon]|uniref:5,10-methylenetetrahydrofolate reductase n=1 Tax=Thermoproteota archaeon TaxID=2056631 RepID=A0A497ER53_9CREN|nr:MAG: 5,10-methylenetetrahydrofolate reductase [Candidatus Verstraetearchaeota archaeon]
MMGQKQKPLEEILRYLEGKRKIVLMGCGGCATIFRTGDPEAIDRMADELTKHGKEVLAKIKLPFGVFCCYLPMSSQFLKANEKVIAEADAILMMACGDGTQAVRSYLDNEMNIVKPIFTANNAMGSVGEGPSNFVEKCMGCGDCVLAETGGICPLTQCSKGLLNGPCGGTTPDGKCEVDPEKDCAWLQIFKRLEKIGELDKFLEIRVPKDWSLAIRPRRLSVTPIDLMSKLKELKSTLEAMGV